MGKALSLLEVHNQGIFNEATRCLNDSKASLELFRHGGFGTVDEFSKLASEKYPDHVQVMKRLTQLALSLHNPEEKFHESDYYPFIQRLFDEQNLYRLKPNITVISYNYDCYLEYLLIKAQGIRNKLGEQPDASIIHRNRLSSGFFKPDDEHSLAKLAQADGQFKHLKLHGSITGADVLSHKQMFEVSGVELFKLFASQNYKTLTPPIVFPWELFDSDQKFIQPEQFIFYKQARVPGVKDPGANIKERQANILYNLYKAIWEGARDAIQNAHKISFVGLSMHDYLQAGLKYLFHNKSGEVEVVVANKGNEEYIRLDSPMHPASPTGRVGTLLRRICPNFVCVRSSSDFDGIFRAGETFDSGGLVKKPDYGITSRCLFSEFIEKEMD